MKKILEQIHTISPINTMLALSLYIYICPLSDGLSVLPFLVIWFFSQERVLIFVSVFLHFLSILFSFSLNVVNYKLTSKNLNQTYKLKITLKKNVKITCTVGFRIFCRHKHIVAIIAQGENNLLQIRKEVLTHLPSLLCLIAFLLSELKSRIIFFWFWMV